MIAGEVSLRYNSVHWGGAMTKNLPTSAQIRARITELRAEAQQLLNDNKVAQAWILIEYAASLEEEASHSNSRDEAA